jgi:hypothetical protein
MCIFWSFFCINAYIFKGLLGHKNPVPKYDILYRTCLKRLRKTCPPRDQENQCAGRDSKQTTPEQTHEALPLSHVALTTLIPHLKGTDPVRLHKRHDAYPIRLAPHATGVSATPRSGDLELSLCHAHTSSASSSPATIITKHSATVNYVEKNFIIYFSIIKFHAMFGFLCFQAEACLWVLK